jgi:hypothetical protein
VHPFQIITHFQVGTLWDHLGNVVKTAHKALKIIHIDKKLFFITTFK